MSIIIKGSTKKIFKKKIKNTPMLILFRIVQGFQKYIWLVCQTSPESGIIFKVDDGSTEISHRCARIERLNPIGYFLIFDKIFLRLALLRIVYA